ncbi:MAG TPA: hypothetical protein VLT87_23410, partial [Thermoanaerobaculia bacterium]|nr:hypothetical protein [Thermoanaerobaculia bacterium]
MKSTVCSHEPAVLDAARRDVLPEEVRGHLEGCEDCRETFRVARSLSALARETRPAHSLPSAGQLWWRAEVVRKLLEQQGGAPDPKAIRPAFWGEAIGIAFAVAVLILFVSVEGAKWLGSASGNNSLLWIAAALALAPLGVLALLGLLV